MFLQRVTVVLPLILMIPILLVPPLRDRPECMATNGACDPANDREKELHHAKPVVTGVVLLPWKNHQATGVAVHDPKISAAPKVGIRPPHCGAATPRAGAHPRDGAHLSDIIVIVTTAACPKTVRATWATADRGVPWAGATEASRHGGFGNGRVGM